MPQIFHPSTNNLARASFFGGILMIALIVGGLALFFQSSYVTRVGVPVDQPVDFSHERHVRGNGIDCRFCHVSVEQSSFADIPPVHTCMSCHSQIFADSPALAPIRASYESGEPFAWNEVYNLPEFVYFNHGIHVKKGVGCETCHGRVDLMPAVYKTETMFMGWCLECHRNPERYVRPQEAVYEMGWVPPEGVDQAALGRALVEVYDIAEGTVLDDCYVCHR